ncbi:MAG: RluA family pseudouridine synthase [Bacteroidota bacterium]
MIEGEDDRQKIHIIVPAGEHRKRIDVYLTQRIEHATRTKIQAGIEAGLVLVNGKKIKSSYQLNSNDSILVTLPHPTAPDALPENIPLSIVYEDDALLIVNKAAGMVTHPAYGNYTGTLVNALLYHCNSLSSMNTALRPGIVHRLDKDTTGLIVVAKTDTSHAFLAKQFSRRTIEREYWAVVWGEFKEKKGEIDANLGRSKKDRKKIAVTKEGKHAVTEYKVLAYFDFLSLVRLHLKTGRTHQIRVHLAHIGHPVFGDPTYGGRSSTWGGLDGSQTQRAVNLLKKIPRQALHAKTIGFIHPTTKEFMRFDSELPDDMKEVLAGFQFSVEKKGERQT